MSNTPPSDKCHLFSAPSSNSQRYLIAENSGQGNPPASCCQTRGCEYLAKMLGRQTCVLGCSPQEATGAREVVLVPRGNRFIHRRVRLWEGDAGLWHRGCITEGD